MSFKCDNYDTCQKYGIYGACSSDDKDFSTCSCNVFEKQAINILASIDEKLSAFLDQSKNN